MSPPTWHCEALAEVRNLSDSHRERPAVTEGDASCVVVLVKPNRLAACSQGSSTRLYFGDSCKLSNTSIPAVLQYISCTTTRSIGAHEFRTHASTPGIMRQHSGIILRHGPSISWMQPVSSGNQQGAVGTAPPPPPKLTQTHTPTPFLRQCKAAVSFMGLLLGSFACSLPCRG